MMIPRLPQTSAFEPPASRLLPVETFIGAESTNDTAGQVTLSFEIEELRYSTEPGEMPTPVAVLLCSSDARALGKALIDSADVAERLAEEVRCRK